MKKLLVTCLTLVCLVGGTAGAVSAGTFKKASATAKVSFSSLLSDDYGKMTLDIECNVKPHYVTVDHYGIVVAHYAEKNLRGGALSNYSAVYDACNTLQNQWPTFYKNVKVSKWRSKSIYAGGYYKTEEGHTVSDKKTGSR